MAGGLGLTLDEFNQHRDQAQAGLEQELPGAGQMGARDALGMYRTLADQGYNDDQIGQFFAARGWAMPPTGIGAEFGRAVERGALSSAGAAAQGVGAMIGSQGLAQGGAGLNDMAADPSLSPGVASMGDVHGLRDVPRYLAGLVGQTLPESAGIAAAGIAAGMAAPAAPVIAGGLAAGGAAFLPNLGRNVQQQLEGGASPDDVVMGSGGFGKAALGAAAQSALDSIIGGRLSGLIQRGVLNEAKAGLVRRALTEAAIDAPIEAGTEAAQEAVQMLQADPDLHKLIGPEGRQRLLENALGGFIIGGAMGAAGGALPHRHAQEAPEEEPVAEEPVPEAVPPQPTEADRIAANRQAGLQFGQFVDPSRPRGAPTFEELKRGPQQPGILARQLGFERAKDPPNFVDPRRPGAMAPQPGRPEGMRLFTPLGPEAGPHLAAAADGVALEQQAAEMAGVPDPEAMITADPAAPPQEGVAVPEAAAEHPPMVHKPVDVAALKSVAAKRGAQEVQHLGGFVDPTDTRPYADLEDALQNSSAAGKFGNVQAHGIAGMNPEQQLAKLLTTGIDQKRAWHTGPLGKALDQTVRAAGLGAKIDSPYVLLARPGVDMKADGIAAVVVNGAAKGGLPELRTMFPGVNFLTPDQLDGWAADAGRAAPDRSSSAREQGDAHIAQAEQRIQQLEAKAADARTADKPAVAANFERQIQATRDRKRRLIESARQAQGKAAAPAPDRAAGAEEEARPSSAPTHQAVASLPAPAAESVTEKTPTQPAAVVAPEVVANKADAAPEAAETLSEGVVATVAPKTAFDPERYRNAVTGRIELPTWSTEKDAALEKAKARLAKLENRLAKGEQLGHDPLERDPRFREGAGGEASLAQLRQTVRAAKSDVAISEAVKRDAAAAEQASAQATEAPSEGPAEESKSERPAAIQAAAADANPEPTEAQAEAGNYRKGHVRLHGLDVSIETPAGAERRGKGADGKPWSVTMPAHYGYFRRTEGADGDHVDTYIAPDSEADTAFVVDQVDADTGRFDEHKVILGTKDEASARKLYEAGFSDGRGKERMGAITPMSIDGLKGWLREGNTKKPVGKLARRVNEKPATASKVAQAKPKATQALPPKADEKPAASKKPAKPESFTRFVARAGGIDPKERSEISDAVKRMVPGIGPMFRKPDRPGAGRRVGHSLDQLREKAIEAGYLRDDATTDDVVRLLEDEAEKRRTHVPAADVNDHLAADGEKRAAAEADRYDDAVAATRAQVQQHAAEHGLDLSADEVSRSVASVILDGMPLDEAVEAAVMQAGLELDRHSLELGEPLDDIPFDRPNEAVERGQGAAGGPARDEGRAPEGDQAPAAGDGPRGQEPAGARQPQAEPGAEGLDQLVLPGAERSAQQAMAARDARGGMRGGAKALDEGLFAPKPDERQTDIEQANPAEKLKAAFAQVGEAFADLVTPKKPAEPEPAANVEEAPQPEAPPEPAEMGTAAPAPALEEPVFSAKVDDAKAFAQQVDAFLRGKLKPSVVPSLGPVPAVLKALGFDGKQMQIKQHVLSKVLIEKHHENMSAEIIKDLPNLLADPVMVFDSDTVRGSLVALVEATARNGAPVVAALHVTRGFADADVVSVRSVYGKDSPFWLRRQIREGRLRYVNKSKSRSWPPSARLQSPIDAAVSGSAGKILTEADIVNSDPQNRAAARDKAPTPATRAGGIVSKALALARQINPRIKAEFVRELFGEGPALEASGGTAERQRVAGAAYKGQGLIKVALDAEDPDVLRATAHEAWHTIEDMLTAKERDLLHRAYPGEGKMTATEATAYGFERWVGNRFGNEHPPAAKSVFAKAMRFVRALGNLLRGHGFQTVEDVFERALSGEIAARQPGQISTQDGPQYRAAWIADPATSNPVEKALQAARSVAVSPEARARVWLKIRNDVFDRLASVKDAELRWAKKNRGQDHLLDARESGAKMAMMALDDAGRLQVAMQKAPLVWDAAAGIARPHKSVGGLQWVFEALKDQKAYDDYQEYAYAKRAQRLKAEGRENLLTDADIAAGLAKRRPEFDQTMDRWQQFNDAMLQFSVDTGVLSQDAKDAYASTMDYVPFYRVYEQTGELMGPGELRRGLSNPTLGIKQLKGGTAQLADLYDNVVRNTSVMASAGLRNVAMQRIHGMLKDLGEVDPVAAHETKGQDSVSFYDQGKRVWFRPHDDLVFTALAGMRPEQMNGIVRALHKVSGIYRTGITSSPAFMLRNWIRGVVGTWVQTGRNVSAAGNTLTGMKAYWGKDPIVDSIRAATGFGGYAFGEAGGMTGKHLRRLTIEHKRAMGRIHDAWQAWEKVGESTEMADRIAVAQNLLKAGHSEAEAAFQAMNLMPYSQHGAAPWVRFLTLTVPFMNARLQGLARMLDTTSGSDARMRLGRQIIMRGMLLSGLTAALWAINNSDDESREKYEAIPPDEKLSYWTLFLGNTKVNIPKPFEFGHVFATAIEAALDAATKDQGPKDARALAAGALGQTFGFDTYVPLPQALVPGLEVATNYDFWRQRPIENAATKRLPTAERTGPSVSFTAEMLAKAVPAFADLSPLEVQHLVDGYFGLMGKAVTASVDAVAGGLGLLPTRPAGYFGAGVPGQLASMLGADALVKDAGSASFNRWVEDFYETKRLADETYAGARELALRGQVDDAREMIAENRGLVAMRPTLTKVDGALRDVSRAIRSIYQNPRMDAEAKRRALEPLVKQRNAVASQIMHLTMQVERQMGRAA